MENSSKALIIAGSILIAILLISVGVIIMNSTGNTQQTVEDVAKTTEARSLNSQLTPYEGKNQSAAQVRSLKATIESINANLSATEKIEIKHKAASGGAVSDIDVSTLASNKTYSIELDYTGGNGRVKTVYVVY